MTLASCSEPIMEVEIMNRDTLYLLQPGFDDPAYPGQKFYCEHCALMEGVLASFPELGKNLDIRHIAWPRPRQEVIALVGEENQSLPLFILTKGNRSVHQTGEYGGNAFVSDKEAILAVLSERHGFPNPHP